MAVIAPHYKDTDFPRDEQGQILLTPEQMIDIFYDRVYYWQLDIADMCLNGGIDLIRKEIKPIEGSGFAVLSICFSYFEMIAQYQEGFVPKTEADLNRSKHFFERGFFSVFPELEQAKSTNELPELMNLLYKGVRCGLYHDGITATRIILTGEPKSAVLPVFDSKTQTHQLVINPHRLPGRLKAHLVGYVNTLQLCVAHRDDPMPPIPIETWMNFEARMRYDRWQVKRK